MAGGVEARIAADMHTHNRTLLRSIIHNRRCMLRQIHMRHGWYDPGGSDGGRGAHQICPTVRM